MFNNTNIIEDLPLKVSKNLPRDAVGLTFFESPTIKPSEIINVFDNSEKIKSNNAANKPKTVIKTEDVNGEIRIDSDGYNKFTVGETINVNVTNRFKGDTPLFYKGVLKLPIQTKTVPNKKNIKFVDALNYEIQLDNIEIVFENILDEDEIATDKYNVIIYSAYELPKEIFVKYNGVINGKTEEQKEKLSFEETLKQNIDYELIKREEDGFFKGENFKDKVAYIQMNERLKFEDKRNLIKVIYKITSENFASDPIQEKIINPDFSINKEELNVPDVNDYNQNLYYLLGGKTPIEYFINKDNTLSEVDFENETFKLEIIDDFEDKRLNDSVIIDLDPKGKRPIGAKVFCNTGYGYKDKLKLTDTLNYDLEDGNYLSRYGIKINDSGAIKLKLPLLNFSDSHWSVHIDYGYFYQERNGTVYKYVLDEINNKFDNEIGLPYNKIIGEKPLIINKDLIKTRVNNIVNINDYPQIYKYNQYGIKEQITIKKIENDEGLIYVENINKNDELFIDYIYKKDSLKYNGFYDKTIDKFFYLDLKPTKDNYSTFSFLSNRIDNNLFIVDRPIYFYLKPKYEIKNNSITKINEDAYVYHSFDKVESDVDLLLGTIIVSPNISKGDIELTDIRQKGGGIKAEFKDTINTEKEIDVNSFWDYGYWNGTPYNENNVVVINVDKSILKVNGGYLTKEDVLKKVNKWIPFGNMPVINYVTAYKKETINLEEKVERDITNKIEHHIDFWLDEYQTVPNSDHMISIYNQTFNPQLMIERLDEPLNHKMLGSETYDSIRSIYKDHHYHVVNTTKSPKANLNVYDKTQGSTNDLKRIRSYNTVEMNKESIKTTQYNTVDTKAVGIEIYEK